MTSTATETQDAVAAYIDQVQRAQNSQGSERKEAFDALIDQFRFAALSWAYRMLGDVQAAQDAVQEAFITAYQKLDELRDPAAFPLWLRRIVRTQCSRDLRRPNRAVALDEETNADEDTASTAETRLTHDRLWDAVRALPEHERVVTEWFYRDGYSQQEIAETLSLPLTTVKKRLEYARRHLRETMPPISRLMLHAA